MLYQNRKIYVYDHFSNDVPVLLGYLYVDSIRGTETYSFEYDNDWLKKIGTVVTLDPEILPYGGRQYSVGGVIFGMFADTSPDRWGRTLMNKRERILADKEGRKPRKLTNADYLLGVYDESRMGGIRLKTDLEGEFISSDKEAAVPPWSMLRNLEEATRQFESGEKLINEEWLSQLIRPGSSLGGARPKATVEDLDGTLWIAKFPSKHDENNTGAWEKVTSDLAKMCTLTVPESRLETFSSLGSTFLVKRFDRRGIRRVHFASAMTLLGKTDGASAVDGTSYLDIASFIKSYGSNPKSDLRELWKNCQRKLSLIEFWYSSASSFLPLTPIIS